VSEGIPKDKDALSSLWSTSHYLPYPNVIPISWSRLVKSTAKDTWCFLLITWATSESAFRSNCAFKQLQVCLLKKKPARSLQMCSQEQILWKIHNCDLIKE
jgi:hypothetical protein